MTLSGPVVGSSQLFKSGTGVLELPGVNTYSGGTFANGTVIVNGTTAFGTSSSTPPAHSPAPASSEMFP
jgi:autotransporter-associated beta strand protein